MDCSEKDQELCDVLEIKFSEVICNFLEFSRETLKDDFAIISTALLSSYACLLQGMGFERETIEAIAEANKKFLLLYFDENNKNEG